jgi:hypothetical protein
MLWCISWICELRCLCCCCFIFLRKCISDCPTNLDCCDNPPSHVVLAEENNSKVEVQGNAQHHCC